MPRSSTARPEPNAAQRLLLVQNSTIFEHFGGIEYYQDDFLQMATGLWGLGTSVCVAPRRSAETRVGDCSYGVRFVSVPKIPGLGPLVNRYWPPLLLAAKSEANRIRPTLLVAGHISLAPLVHGLHRWTGIPYAVLAYGIECWGEQWPQDNWAMGEASSIFSISEWTKAILVKQGFAADKIAVVPPVLSQAYEKMPSPRRAREGGGVLTLLTISRLEASERYKGQDHVLHALYRLRYSDPDLRFKYIIQGDGSDKPRLEELVNRLGLGEIVEFRPGVRDRIQFETAYREADLYVMPSRFGKWDGKWRGEGFGIVYLEAAAFGLPSIAYDCGGATDIITAGVDGWLVVPDSITDLANAIAQAAKSPKIVFEMGKKAHEMVMSRFTRAQISQRLKSAVGAVR